LATAFSTPTTTVPLPSTRANIKWSKILINGLPTGVFRRTGPYSPNECQAELVLENPSYATLIVQQKPSWVRPPHSYKPGSASSLVVAFEDPDGSKLKTLLADRYLYAFGTRTSIKKWKQCPKTTKDKSPKQTSKHSKAGSSDTEEDVEIILQRPNPPPPQKPLQHSQP
jgi:hypothetical protein